MNATEEAEEHGKPAWRSGSNGNSEAKRIESHSLLSSCINQSLTIPLKREPELIVLVSFLNEEKERWQWRRNGWTLE